MKVLAVIDMQKDFIVSSFNSVTLDPTHSQKVIRVRDITQTVIYTASGETFTIDGGYLDIGILDTMKDLFVNFIGAVTFSVIGYFYIKHRGKGKLAQAFIPTLSEDKEASLPEGDPGAPPESE